MYACYVDESGHCGIKYNDDQPVEVVCGVLMDLSKISKTQSEHRQILEILRNHGIPAEEFKGSHIYRGDGAWKGVPAKVRTTVFELLLDWGKDRYCKYIVCPIDSATFFNKKGNGCKISTALNAPYEAGVLKVVCSVQRHHKNKKNNKGMTFVILDEQGGHDANVMTFFSGDLSITDDYTGYQPKPRAKVQPERFDQIVDVPHFSKSHLAISIQLADIVAFVVNRHLQLTSYERDERFKGEANQILEWYQKIGLGALPPSVLDPSGKGNLMQYFRDLNPPDWTAKSLHKK